MPLLQPRNPVHDLGLVLLRRYGARTARCCRGIRDGDDAALSVEYPERGSDRGGPRPLRTREPLRRSGPAARRSGSVCVACPQRADRLPLQPGHIRAAHIYVLAERPCLSRADEPLHVPVRDGPALSGACVESSPPTVGRVLGMAVTPHARRVLRRVPAGSRGGTMVLLSLYRGFASGRRRHVGLHVCERAALEPLRGRSDHGVPHADGVVSHDRADAPQCFARRLVQTAVLLRLRPVLPIGEPPV